MPGLITHYLLGQNVIKQMSNSSNTLNKSKNYLLNIILKNLDAYNLGTPGPDVFFYYLPSLLGKSNKNIGSIMHTKGTGEFFNIYIDYMNVLNKQDKEIAISYLCGFLGHYVLDSTTHPYIYYNSGFSSSIKESKIYGAKHRTFETLIDTFMLQKLRGLKPSNFNTSQVFQISRKNLSVIVSIMTKTLNKTYGFNITTYLMEKIYQLAKKESKFLICKNNKRKVIMTYIENKTIKYPVITSLMYTDYISNTNDCLNEKQKIWYLPWDNRNPKYQSFFDLYNSSSTYILYILSQLENYLNNSLEKSKLLSNIGNNSYHTGLDCNHYVTFKYFIIRH